MARMDMLQCLLRCDAATSPGNTSRQRERLREEPTLARWGRHSMSRQAAGRHERRPTNGGLAITPGLCTVWCALWTSATGGPASARRHPRLARRDVLLVPGVGMPIHVSGVGAHRATMCFSEARKRVGCRPPDAASAHRVTTAPPWLAAVRVCTMPGQMPVAVPMGACDAPPPADAAPL